MYRWYIHFFRSTYYVHKNMDFSGPKWIHEL